MKFRNPWIDPRIARVCPDDARAYLLGRGWKSLGLADNPIMEVFEAPGGGEEMPTVLLPLQVDQGPMLQRMIDVIGELARVEDRWAVDVLNDVLQGSPNGPANGSGLEHPARAAAP
jgi:hypothetical protein